MTSEKKKGQKRKKCTSSIQPLMPIRGQDGPPSSKDLSYAIHVAGRPMLPPKMLDIATSDMQSVHNSILTLETMLLRRRIPRTRFYGQGATQHGLRQQCPRGYDNRAVFRDLQIVSY